MSNVQQLLSAAFRHHQAGELAQAESLYQQALALQPDHADAWHLSGVAAYQGGRLAEAVEKLRRAISLNDRQAAFHNHLGAALAGLKQSAEAEAAFRLALALAPDDAQLHYNLASLLMQTGRSSEAIEAFQSATRLAPNFDAAYFNLGNALRDQHRWQEAIVAYEQAIRSRANYAEAWNNLGTTYNACGKHDQARSALERAIALRPGYTRARCNLGVVHTDEDRLTEAVALYDDILSQEPTSAEAHNNRGVALMHMGRLDEALASAQRALEVNPDYLEARKNRAVIRLFQGDYDRGWPEFEVRFQCKDYSPNPFSQPKWDGGSLDGRRILLHAEQGLGDTIQFIRYAKIARKRGGFVILRVAKALRKLLTNFSGADELITDDQPTPPFDVQASLMSLPAIVGTSLDTVPADVPYVTADPTIVASWRMELERRPTFKIGIAWQGNPQFRGDRTRSLPLACFEPLAALPNVELISLQKGLGCEQLAALQGRFQVTDFSARLDETTGPFMDTAAIMAAIDLVITSDTSTAHLAGALGATTWVALAAVPEWRWMLNRANTPWYPTMRLFRQPSPGDWSTVFEHMAAHLAEFLANRRQSLLN